MKTHELTGTALDWAVQQCEGQRTVICVERMVNGKVKWLPLADQWTYREWVGCFSLLK